MSMLRGLPGGPGSAWSESFIAGRVGLDDEGLCDQVAIDPIARRQFERIPDAQIAHRTERRVTVPRDADVARLPRKRCVLDVPGSPRERLVVAAFWAMPGAAPSAGY